ncbi:MAG: nuclear transport factor 2 family protein [Proteobacteria bacterium]|nr:nuclear transport factor 2 family protein [Pseudomonadota bacterium]
MRNTLSDRDGIAQTIDLYFAGMYQSKAEDIEASFHPNATITGFRGDTGELVEMDCGEFRNFAASQPPPAENGEPFEMTLDSVDIKGKVAMVRVTDRYLNKRFTDLMLLLKTDDGWRIYSKLWHAEPL